MTEKTKYKMDNYYCGGYYFSSNFDSGNLAKVELVRITEVIIDFAFEDPISTQSEFNVWTRPDCGGTEYENPNRSWFLFSIHGGASQSSAKISVVNLNKQAKLFSQGMHPVCRVGETGEWELIKNNPTYFAEKDDFTISFIHRCGDNSDTKYYYAFTFPFTYTECQMQLERFNELYSKSQSEMDYIINKVCKDKDKKSSSKADITKTESEQNVEDDSKNDEKLPLELRVTKLQQSIKLKNLKNLTTQELENEIYFHRDLLIYSVENRNLDLLTITSFHGIQNEREDTLDDLFPNIDISRSYKFNNKKIIFISSRVHPGETPASYVLNGFLNLLLDKSNLISSILRKMYVFKIVPILNPDGVYNGFYRSDTYGSNLNRVYLCPDLHTQPTIYAVRKLIRYYHHGRDISEKIEAPTSKFWKDNDMEIPFYKENVNESVSTIESSENAQSSISDVIPISTIDAKSKVEARAICSMGDNRQAGRVFHEQFITEIKPVVIASTVTKKFGNKKDELVKVNTEKSSVLPRPHSSISSNQETRKRNHILKLKSTVKNESLPRKEYKSRQPTAINVTGQFRPKRKENAEHNTNCDCFQAISENSSEPSIFKEKSNIFLYIDLHGHASKKGVFMYGNYLPNAVEAVECMLLPRLMSLNSHHFHFDACVFSERNMYHKGKRDGLSKEGSGRVAIYKATGLVKCYTLESNYNTGKYINLLPPRGREQYSRKVSLNVPKYTPAVFDEVGRALGPSILDLTNSNPISRLQNSEFKTLHGLRNSLRSYLDKTQGRPSNTKTSTLRCKRVKMSPPLAQQSDVLKENKQKINFIKVNSMFSKKEGPCQRKKGKILCDVLTGSVSKFSDHVPHKRTKVSKKPLQIDASNELADAFLADNVPKKTVESVDVLNLAKSSGDNKLHTDIGQSASIDISCFYEGNSLLSKYQSNNVLIDVDLDKPCCSRSLTRNDRTVQPPLASASIPLKTLKVKKVAKHVNLLPSSSSSSMSSSQSKRPPSVKIRARYTGTSALKQLKRVNKECIKVKKKKSVISETKRKKSRVF